MSNTKHTPGPWIVLTEGTENDCIVRTIMGPGNGPRNLSEVALVTTGSYPDDVEAANARLISCAPELLQALKENVSMNEQTLSYRENNGLTAGNVFLQTAIENGKKAISKAEQQ